jgi:hypothetical protein
MQYAAGQLFQKKDGKKATPHLLLTFNTNAGFASLKLI